MCIALKEGSEDEQAADSELWAEWAGWTENDDSKRAENGLVSLLDAATHMVYQREASVPTT